MARHRVDALILVEHVARELDIACAVRHLAKKRCGLNVEIASMYLETQRTRAMYDPKVVALPYCFSVHSYNVADLIRAWPNATYLNLAYEQIFRPHQLPSKTPSDPLARDNVLHHSWAKFNAQFLTEHGVRPENILLNGNPTYSLYDEPYAAYFPSRVELARRNGLDPNKPWVFIPENYGAAFGSDLSIRKPVGFSTDQAMDVRRFVLDSFDAAVNWWDQLARENDVELIIRPRPATSEAAFRDAVLQRIGSAPLGLHIIKSGTTREWILASDSVFSSYSTSLIESALALKPTFMFAPLEFPAHLDAEWHHMVTSVETYQEFREAACSRVENVTLGALGSWATREMKSTGDPISNLVDLLNQTAAGRIGPAVPVSLDYVNRAAPTPPKPSYRKRVTSKGRRVLAGIYHRAIRRMPARHDIDRFSQSDVDQRVSRWAAVLG